MTSLLILYGSETGNCEDLVKRITWEAKRRRIGAVTARALEEEPLANLRGHCSTSRFVLFVCSTTGQGDVPLNMQLFWKRLMRRNLPDDALSGLVCSVIGLGDSSYVKYNFVAKKLFRRLKQLGANLELSLALGDDQHDHGFDAGVDPFLQQLWLILEGLSRQSEEKDLANSPDVRYRQSDSTDSVQLPAPTFAVRYTMCGKRVIENSNPSPPFNYRNAFSATVLSNERVTTVDHFQDVRLLKLGIGSDLAYSPADVCYVIPENSPQETEAFMSLLGLDQDKYKHGAHIHLEANVQENSVTSDQYARLLHTRITIFDLVLKHLAIHNVPKRSFFELLWKFSRNDLERSKLKEFSTLAGQEELYSYCIRPKRTILEVLSDFAHTAKCIPVEYLFDLVPAIRPRAFSIASSPRAHPGELHVLMAVVEYRTLLKQPRTGLCSKFLASRQPGSAVDIWIGKGTFSVPMDKPLLMVGPGTGVAPFRSLVHERDWLRKKGEIDAGQQDLLFFGCRSRKADYYFNEEWPRLGTSLTAIVAFSRDTADRKVYVQHKMWEERDAIIELLLQRECTILVAGSSKQMPQNVREMLVDIVKGARPEDDGEEFVTRLETCRRLQYECWS